MTPNGPDWTAIATMILAGVTLLIVLEARTSRIQAIKRDREAAFRAALMELAQNVQLVEAWKPLLEDAPPEKWLEMPLGFAAMRDLLARVWIPTGLWNRVMVLMTNLRAYVNVITAQVRGLPPDAAARGEYTPQRENIRNLYYLIDLYLKQLACYLTAEMRRQRLGTPQEWEDDRSLFTPLSWRYDVAFGSGSTTQAVYNIETGPAWPPFTLQAPEPSGSMYRECLLERLIERARKRSEEDEAQIRSAYAARPETEEED